jgi:hypothetical protein
MAVFHVVAILPAGGRKTVMNKSEADVMTSFVLPFIESSTITTRWGKKVQRRQALELRVYKTNRSFYKKEGLPFDDFIKGKRNVYATLANVRSCNGDRAHACSS